VSTCRRPCSAAGWTRRRIPSHSPGSPQPDRVPVPRRMRAAGRLRRPFSHPLGAARRHRPPLLRLAHRRSRDHRRPGRPRQYRRELRRSPCQRTRPRQQGCCLSRCRPARYQRRPHHRPRPSRPRQHLPCRRAARLWRPRRRPPCRRAARRWQPRPGSPHRPELTRPHRPRHCPPHPCPHSRARLQRPRRRRPVTAGAPIRAGRGQATAGVPAPPCRCPRPCRPPSGHSGPAGPTASLA